MTGILLHRGVDIIGVDANMALIRRNKGPDGSLNEWAGLTDDVKSKRSASGRMIRPLARLVFIAVALLVLADTESITTTTTSTKEGGIVLAKGVILHIDWHGREEGSDDVSVGLHHATLTVPKDCPYPRVQVRLRGSTLEAIPLTPHTGNEWKGSFSTPVNGTYAVDARWYGCHHGQQDWTSPREKPTVNVKGSNTADLDHPPRSFWLVKNFVTKDEIPNDYVWVKDLQPSTLLNSTIDNIDIGSSIVAKEGTPIPPIFDDLSNYELLCWVGSQSAEQLHESFRSLRPQLFPSQRPFKFHYYNVTDFAHPDKDWDETNKLRFRKCKNILISVDEPENPDLSQEEYKHQVKTFLNHMVKCFDDETFPIWMLTVNKAPSNLCHSPTIVSSHHPCNDALFDLFSFRQKLPERVKLMVNTDLTEPMFGEDWHHVAPVIAMRIFALAGAQVQVWRDAGQRGTVKGLVRNGVTEPNIDFKPYDFS